MHDATARRMTTWTFFGKILPERIPLSITPPEWTVGHPDFGLRYRVKIQIADAQIVAPTVIESGQIDVHSLRNLVENDIRMATDLVGYLVGGSFDVDIISATSDEGSAVIFESKSQCFRRYALSRQWRSRTTY